MHHGWVALVSVACACARPAAPPAPQRAAPAPVVLPAMPDRASWPDFEALVDRVALDLHGRRLSAEERAALRTRGQSGDSLRSIYEAQLDTLIDRDFFRDLVSAGYMRPPQTASLFMGSMSRYRTSAGWLYYMPHTVANAAGPPCSEADRVRVRPWWSVGQEIEVCRDSYRPDKIFDEVGYCAGQPEPTVPVAPRKGCGCGPLLSSCAPPVEERPDFASELQRDVIAEVVETGADIMRTGRLDELMTTTRTWQTGLVELPYLRRELVGEVHRRGWSPELETRFVQRIAKLDVFGPGRWVDRGTLYAGTGLFFTTPATQAAQPTYRVLMVHALRDFECTTFESVRVDSHALLTAVGKNHDALRALSVDQSPMRTMIGCKSCHAPMDFAAGFMRELTTPLYGGYPTGLDASGTLYVSGADDLRGAGTGFAGLSGLLVKQPEFAQCATWRLIARFTNPQTIARDPDLVHHVQQTFEDSHHALEPTLRAILESDRYTAPVRLDENAVASCAKPRPVAIDLSEADAVLKQHCTDCHDKDHRIDLSVPPDKIPTATWRSIAQVVANGIMPPTDHDAASESDLDTQFALGIEQRRVLVRTATLVLKNAGGPPPVADRWSPDFATRITWLRHFGRTFLPTDEVERLVTGGGLTERSAYETEDLNDLELGSIAYALCKAAITANHWDRPATDDEMVEAVFRASLGRPPTSPERQAAHTRLAKLRASSAANAEARFCTIHLMRPATTDIVFAPRPTQEAAACE